MSERPDHVEISAGLGAIPPQDWDNLTCPARADKTRFPINGLHGVSDSTPQADLTHELRCKEFEALESTPQPIESNSEVAESGPEEDTANPFISHAFLSALEETDCVGGTTGWTPLHLFARAANGALCGALPLYAKSHSRGEYVFDHAFAQAYHERGQRYYPKLQISVPFTPVCAPKLLIAPDADEAATRAALLQALEVLRVRLDASSIHATFLDARDAASFADAGYLAREDCQFHFFNRGYRDYADFLDALASRKRKALRKERREALQAGITVEWITGNEITEAHWDAFFAFYQDTGARKWGSPYLTRALFSLVGARMADKVLLVMARRAGRYIAGALNFIGADTLYGRNWGAIEHHPGLHFELCYHQAIDFALARGLKRVEAGAQGDHKLARGYEPVITRSAHRFADPGFATAIARYLQREREQVAQMGAEMTEFLPFRRGPAA